MALLKLTKASLESLVIQSGTGFSVAWVHLALRGSGMGLPAQLARFFHCVPTVRDTCRPHSFYVYLAVFLLWMVTVRLWQTEQKHARSEIALAICFIEGVCV